MNIVPQQMEMFVASQIAENLGDSDRLMEMILERRNMFRALTQVRANKGAPGVDGLSVTQLEGYLKRHWPKIRQDLLDGKYQPRPVRRKEIDKPDGGVRLLGIPAVLDRLIQQAVLQIVEQVWDPLFSESSFGFRPGRSQHDAVLRAKSYLLEGYTYVVDMDLSKFFDRVNHDRLMSRLATKIRDKRVLKLIRRYLTAGAMIDGVVIHADEGTPQGGPLSPLLSNIVLDELDKELEKRGHKFVRYADDFMIYCKIRIHHKTIQRFKDRVRELTSRNSGKSIYQIIEKLNEYLRGWWNYFRLTEARYIFKALNIWIIRRLRCIVWKQWKNPRTRVRNLEKLGIAHEDAVLCGNSRKKYWRMSKVKWVMFALSKEYFLSLGLFLPGKELS